MKITATCCLLLLTLAGCANAPEEQFSGSNLYLDYCASCHGVSGEGDGQVAAVMQTTVPNLRILKQRNGGVFPEPSITEYIDGRKIVPAHGDRRMPVWGDAKLGGRWLPGI
ncbi:MAG: c-type cytochrome [Candidatus Rariloculaceae bacterium]